MVEKILDKIADIEQNTGFDVWSFLLVTVIIAAIILFLKWAFKEFPD